ncbi:MAG: hypothetical protein ACT4P3_06740 [Betaproteobacteria bacterium]
MPSEPVALARLPATFRNTPSCPGCLALTLTLRPDGSFVAREQLGSSEFYDFGRWRESRADGMLQLAGGRDGLRRYAIKAPDLLDSQEGTQGGDLKRVAEVETLRGPFRLMGLYDGRLFKECQTGLAWPLDDSRAAQALKEQFANRRDQPVLISIDGRFEPRGRGEALRVIRTAAVHNERGCPG